MNNLGSKIKLAKLAFPLFCVLILFSISLIQPSNAQVPPYNQSQTAFLDSLYLNEWSIPFGPFFLNIPFYNNPFYGYGYLGYGLPSRNAAVLSSTTLLAASLLATSTVTPTTTTLIGVNTAITLATLGGTGLSTTILATLATTPVPTVPTITTPVIGTTTALLLSGGVSTSTLLLLGI